MTAPNNECPHLDTQEIHTYGWKTVYCVGCDTQWQIPTTAKTRAEVAGPYTEETE